MQPESEKHACLESGTVTITVLEPCECERPIEPIDLTIEISSLSDFQREQELLLAELDRQSPLGCGLSVLSLPPDHPLVTSLSPADAEWWRQMRRKTP